MSKTFVIAEAGANHNRDFDRAKQLIDAAKKSGSDAVKFQTYSSETLYAKNTPNFAGYSNINQLIKDIELPRAWQKDLKAYCDDQGIEFMSTPFDEAAVSQLVDLGVKRLKIAGFESTDFRFVEMVASAKLPLIVSMGLGYKLEYIERIVEIASKYNNDLTLLHCNNAYPTPINDANLQMVAMLHQDDRFRCGFSDHTTSVLTPALAVAMGADVIEKHFTINRSLPGPDHSFALEPEELAEMVGFIRLAEQATNMRTNELTASEKAFVHARRSVVSRLPLKKGDELTIENTTTMRPFFEGCIPASQYHDVLGRRVNKDLPSNSLIKIHDLQL
ncbi:MAG: sialic acid synthase SpsE [Bacteroidia bacterium]|jgi:sialic acid synthase SpsE